MRWLIIGLFFLLALPSYSDNRGNDNGNGNGKGHHKEHHKEHIDVPPGETVEIDNIIITDPGNTTVSGKDSALVISDSGELDNNGMTISLGGTVENSGSIVVSDPVVVEIGGTINNSGVITTPLLDNGGTLISSGTGSTINGNLVDRPISTTIIEAPMTVNGKAMLGGTLVLDFVSKPGSNNVITVTEGINGKFSEVITLQNPKGLAHANIYASNGLDVTFLQPMNSASVDMKTSMSVEMVPAKIVSIVDPNAGLVTLPTTLSYSEAHTIRDILGSSLDRGQVGAWAVTYGDFVDVDPNSKEGSRLTTWGLTIGVSRKLGDGFLAGIVGGYSYTWSNSLNSNLGWGGVYVGWTCKDLYFRQMVFAGGDTFNTSRVALLGTAEGSSNGWIFNEVSSAGYDFHLGGLTFGPVGILQYGLTGTGGYTEHGSAAPLNVASNTQNSFVSNLGLKTNYTLGRLSILGEVGWEHQFFDAFGSSFVSIVGLPSSGTVVYGPNIGHDGLSVAAAIEWKVNETISVGVSYDGQFGDRNYRSTAIIGSIGVRF